MNTDVSVAAAVVAPTPYQQLNSNSPFFNNYQTKQCRAERNWEFCFCLYLGLAEIGLYRRPTAAHQLHFAYQASKVKPKLFFLSCSVLLIFHLFLQPNFSFYLSFLASCRQLASTSPLSSLAIFGQHCLVNLIYPFANFCRRCCCRWANKQWQIGR